MTKQVRTAYRSHRRAAWVVALALALAVAAVVVPLATAGEKTYTMTVEPTSLCAPATNGGVSTTVRLKNTGSPQTAGSAEVYFPPNTVHGVSSPWQLRSNTSSSASGGTKDIVALNNMNLAPGQTKTITVSFKSTANFSTAITAALKQANQFNDSSGTANLFAVQGGFPTLRVTQCLTISGSVYHDRNLDFGYFTGNGAFDDSDIAKVGWTVTLYVKSGSTYSVFATTTTAAEGAYSFTGVPGLADYKVCITASSGDNSQKWGLQSPSGNQDCGPISTATGGPTKSAGHLLPALSANATGKDFQVVPVVGPVGRNTPTSNSTVGGYIVDPSSNSTKADDFYVQDVWLDSDGNTNFRFSPINPCTPPSCPPGKIFLLETLVADAIIADLEGNQVTLRYDDEAPFFDGDLKPMPYCLIDPTVGQPADSLATTGVLPTIDGKKATSCIVTGEQSVSAATGKVHVEYTVYTAYDGGRQIGLG